MTSTLITQLEVELERAQDRYEQSETELERMRRLAQRYRNKLHAAKADLRQLRGALAVLEDQHGKEEPAS